MENFESPIGAHCWYHLVFLPFHWLREYFELCLHSEPLPTCASSPLLYQTKNTISMSNIHIKEIRTTLQRHRYGCLPASGLGIDFPNSGPCCTSRVVLPPFEVSVLPKDRGILMLMWGCLISINCGSMSLPLDRFYQGIWFYEWVKRSCRFSSSLGMV